MKYKVSSNWGGARNYASRVTTSISYQQCLTIDDAVVRSIDIGKPLNRFITINWSIMGIPPPKGSEATARFFKMARDWTNRQGEEIYWAYIREAKENGLNHHLHILIHIPEKISAAFLRKARQWITIIAGAKYKSGAILTRSVGSRVDTYKSNPESYSDNLLTVVRRYLFKGAERSAVKPFELPLWERGGKIYGKRCGHSKTLSRQI